MITQKQVFTSQSGYILNGMTNEQANAAILWLTNRKLAASNDENPRFERMLMFFGTTEICKEDDEHNHGIYVYIHSGMYPNSPDSYIYGNYDPTCYSIPKIYIKFRENEKNLTRVVKDMITELGID